MNRAHLRFLPPLLLAALLVLLLAGLAAAGGSGVGPAAAPPTPETNITFDSDVLSVAVQGNYAYVGLESGVAILDITNPLQPAVLSFIQEPHIEFVQAQDSLLAISNNSTIGFLDVSNPYYPIWLSPMKMYPSMVKDMQILGSYLYIAGKGSFCIIDVHEPTAPDVVFEEYNFDVIGDMTSLAAGINPSDGHTYVYMTGTRWCNPGGCIGNGLLSMDVTDPGQPQVVYASIEEGWAVGTDGEFLYWTDWYGNLNIFALTNPPQPLLLSEVSVPGINLTNGIKIASKQAYLSLGHGEGADVQIWDMSDKATPKLLKSYSDIRHWVGNSVLAVEESQSCLYVAEMERGLRVLCDINFISNPPFPSLVWLPLVHLVTEG